MNFRQVNVRSRVAGVANILMNCARMTKTMPYNTGIAAASSGLMGSTCFATRSVAAGVVTGVVVAVAGYAVSYKSFLEHQARNRPLTPEERAAILAKFQQWADEGRFKDPEPLSPSQPKETKSGQPLTWD